MVKTRVDYVARLCLNKQNKMILAAPVCNSLGVALQKREDRYIKGFIHCHTSGTIAINYKCFLFVCFAFDNAKDETQGLAMLSKNSTLS